MRMKRSKFLTSMFSIIPGAGHMYMGFMKIGLSLMSVFFFDIFLATWLDIAPLLFILPMLWFYSFFDCINRRSATDEEFSLMDDRFLFPVENLIKSDWKIFGKRRLFAGILLLLLGFYMIWSNILNRLLGFIPEEVYTELRNITEIAPQLILSIAIIIVGVRLILGKRQERDINA